MRYTEDVKKKIKPILFKAEDNIPDFLLENLVTHLLNKGVNHEEHIRKAIALATPIYGEQKFFCEELDSYLQGNFKNRVQKAYSTLTKRNGTLLLQHMNPFFELFEISEKSFLYDIHYDVDWKQGEFNDNGSCWFSYEDVSVFRMKFRHMCYKDLAFAMRFYTTKGEPLARCFGVILDGFPVLFNGVGRGWNIQSHHMLTAGLDAFGVDSFSIMQGLRLGEHDHISGTALSFGKGAPLAYRNYNWSDYERFSNQQLEDERLEYFSTQVCKKCGHLGILFRECEYCEGAEYK